MLSEPYGSHYIRWRYQTTSRRRRTIIFSHSFFSTASSNFDMLSESPDERAFVVLFVPRPTTFRRDHLPSASVRGPRQPTHLSSPCTPRPTSPGPAQLLQCSRRVRRGRRDQSGRHGRRHGTVCDVPQACRTRRGMLQPPSTLRHLQFSPRPRHAGCEDPSDARLRGCGGPACALPGSDEGGSCMARAADAPCGAQQTMWRISPGLSCTVQHATCDWQHSAPCHSRTARHVQAVRVRLCTHRHSHSSPGLRAVGARAQACVRT